MDNSIHLYPDVITPSHCKAAKDDNDNTRNPIQFTFITNSTYAMMLFALHLCFRHLPPSQSLRMKTAFVETLANLRTSMAVGKLLNRVPASISTNMRNLLATYYPLTVVLGLCPSKADEGAVALCPLSSSNIIPAFTASSFSRRRVANSSCS